MKTPMRQLYDRWRWGLVLVAAAVAPIGPAVGQERRGLDVYEEQLRVRLDEQTPAAQEKPHA